MLRASHIKPWSDSEPAEKLNPDNGFLLCLNHDGLFDAGLISFADDGTIMISVELDLVDAMLANVTPNMKIQLTQGNKKYLGYHRKYIFKG